jgi:hypothetical protein
MDQKNFFCLTERSPGWLGHNICLKIENAKYFSKHFSYRGFYLATLQDL